MLWNGGLKERVKRRENYGLLIRQVVGGGARPFFVCKKHRKLVGVKMGEKLREAMFEQTREARNRTFQVRMGRGGLSTKNVTF